MIRSYSSFAILIALAVMPPAATGAPIEAPGEEPPTSTPTPAVISIDDHSTYSECYGEVSSVMFSCECEAPRSQLRRLSKRKRSQLLKAKRRDKRNFNTCLGKGLFEDTQAGSSCGTPEGLRSWCERYHAGQQNCCAAECAENQARYCCERHCGRGKFKRL
jgi:hypothetical protein